MRKDIYQIGFLIFDGFPMACLTSMIEPLRAANEISDTKNFNWVLVSEGPKRVEASANVAFETDFNIETVGQLDALVLLSPPTANFSNKRSEGILRKLERHGCTIGAVSGGVFLLAKASVGLNNPYSVHWCYAEAFKNQFPDVVSSEQVIETSNNIITASGAAAAFDLALMLINARLGLAVRAEVACWFQHPIMRDQDVKQIMPTVNHYEASENTPQIANRAIKMVKNRLNDPFSITDIALELGITPRHLTRVFSDTYGQSPSKYFRMIRMDAARQMVLYTNQRIGEIALAVGYTNSTNLRKHYIELFAISPEEEREKINLFRVSGNSPIPTS